MKKSPTLLFIGCGNMGAAIASGVHARMRGVRIVAIDPDVDRARSLVPAGAKIEFYPELEAAPEINPDLVVIAVKPQMFAALPTTCLAMLKRSLTVSIMAGTTLGTLTRTIGSQRVVRVMPNLPAFVGESMSIAVALPEAVNHSDRQFVDAVFGAVGKLQWIETEDAFERAAAMAGCGPGFVFAIAEQFTRAVADMGLPATMADRLVRQTFLGAARMLSEDKRSAAELKRAVTSPNGTTQAGLAQLEAPDGLAPNIQAALRAAYDRALELGQSA